MPEGIVGFRDQHGAFRSRAQLREIEGFGDKTSSRPPVSFESRTAKIRSIARPCIRNRIRVVERHGDRSGNLSGRVIENPDADSFDRLSCVETEVGKYTIADIREELLKPGRDPRDKFVVPKFREDVKEIADLKEGMELEGTVTNVTNFGAFVDLGVHQDGLVHISELSHKYVQDARQAVKVGDIVKVKVIGVDQNMKTNQPLDESPSAQTRAAAEEEEKAGR